jgi:hypothetical protein
LNHGDGRAKPGRMWEMEEDTFPMDASSAQKALSGRVGS